MGLCAHIWLTLGSRWRHFIFQLLTCKIFSRDSRRFFFHVKKMVCGTNAQAQLIPNGFEIGPNVFRSPTGDQGKMRAASLEALLCVCGLVALNTLHILPYSNALSWTRQGSAANAHKSQIDYVFASSDMYDTACGGVRHGLISDDSSSSTVRARATTARSVLICV